MPKQESPRMENFKKDNLKSNWSDLTQAMHYLSAFKSQCGNALVYLDEEYKSAGFNLGDKLAQMKRIEKEVILLERDCLQQIKNVENGKAYYDRYYDLHKTFLTEYLYAASSKNNNVLVKATELDTFFSVSLPDDMGSVKTIGDARLKKLKELAVLDGFGDPIPNPRAANLMTKKIIKRYQRIFLTKRLLIYSYTHSRLTNLSTFTSSTEQSDIWTPPAKFDTAQLWHLLDDQLDYDFEAFTALFPPAPPKVLQAVTVPNDIEKLEAKLAELEAAFRKNYVEVAPDQLDVQFFERHKAEMEALRYSLEERKKEWSYGTRLSNNLDKHGVMDISKNMASYAVSSIGKDVALTLWFAVNGKKTGADMKKMGQDIAVTLMKGSLVTISKLFFGGIINEKIVNSIFSSILPIPSDPVLQDLDVIKEKLSKIEQDVKAIQDSIDKLAKELKSMIANLPADISRELQGDQIADDISRINKNINHIYNVSKVVIKKGQVSEDDVKELRAFQKGFLNDIWDIIKALYDEKADIDIPECELRSLAVIPSSGSYTAKLILAAQRENSSMGFYTTADTLFKIYAALCNELFSYFNNIRPFVQKALHICHSCIEFPGDQDGTQKLKGEIQDTIIVNEMQNNKMSALLYNLSFQLRHGMIGSNNYWLYDSMKQQMLNPYNHNFLSGFALENTNCQQLVWEKDQLKSVIDKTSRSPLFYAISGWMNKEDSQHKYSLFTADAKTFSPCRFDLQLVLAFEDKLKSFAPNNDDLRVIPPYDDKLKGDKDTPSFDYLMSTNATIPLTGGGIKRMALPNTKMYIEWFISAPSAKGDWWRVNVVDKQNHGSESFFGLWEFFVPKQQDNTQQEASFFFDKDMLFFGSQVKIADSKDPETRGISFKGRIQENTFVEALGAFDYEFKGEILPKYSIYADNRLLFTNTASGASGNKRILTGQKLFRGQYITSDNNAYHLGLSPEGKLGVWTVDGNTEIWVKDYKVEGETTVECDYLMLLNDGYLLVCYNRGTLLHKEDFGAKIPSGITADVAFIVTDSGGVSLINKKKEAIYVQPMRVRDTLMAGEKLFPGDSLVSGKRVGANPAITLTFQPDGNLVVKDHRNGSRWASKTQCTQGYVVMDGEGNLLMKDKSNREVWSQKTNVRGGYLRLLCEHDRNYVRIDDKSGKDVINGQLVWWTDIA